MYYQGNARIDSSPMLPYQFPYKRLEYNFFSSRPATNCVE